MQRSASVWTSRLKHKLDINTMDSNSLPHDRAGCFDQHAAGQSTIPHLHIAHAHELLWRQSFRVKCFFVSLQWTIGNPHCRDWEEHELVCAAALLLSTPQLSSQLSHSTLADVTQSCFVVLWTVFCHSYEACIVVRPAFERYHVD